MKKKAFKNVNTRSLSSYMPYSMLNRQIVQNVNLADNANSIRFYLQHLKML